MQEYRPSGFAVLPPIIKNLLIINGIFYLASIIINYRFHIDITDFLGLHYFFSDAFHPYQVITYMFMHAFNDPADNSIIFSHILLNMFGLWMFGSVLENYWGGKKFLIFYVVCGLGAALMHYSIYYFEIQPTIHTLNDYLLNPATDKFKDLFVSGTLKPISTEVAQRLQPIMNDYNTQLSSGYTDKALQTSIELVLQYKKEFLNSSVVIGASGAIFGVLLAFGMLFPNSMLFVFPIPFPVKAKYAVILFGLWELSQGVVTSDNIAHFAHLGGMLFGFILIKIWNRNKPHFY